MKRFFLSAAFVFFIFCKKSFALEAEVFIEPVFSLRNSTTKEALYYDGYFGSDKNKMKSLLVWEESNVFNLGLNLCTALKTQSGISFAFDGGLSFSLPYNQGRMSDSDWTTSGVKFNYSRFKNTINVENPCDIFDNFNAFIKISFKKNAARFFTFAPFLTLGYSTWYFKGASGHGWYGEGRYTSDGKTHSWDDSEAHYFPDGKMHLAGINYRVRSATTFLGLEGSVQFDSFRIFLSCGTSPYTFVLASDRHLGKNDYYTTDDYIHAFFAKNEWRAGFCIQLSKKCELKMSACFTDFLLTRGKEWYNFDDSDEMELSSSDGGYSYKSTELYASFLFRLF